MPDIRDLTSDEDKRRRILLGEGAPTQMSAEDISWAVQHLMGYGSVDAPSPFGHNRDVFMAEHPGYAGGYYNANTGRYDAPDEAPPGWLGVEPQRPGGGAPPGASSGVPPWMSHGDAMSGLPSGGNADARGFPTNPDFYRFEPGMANLPTGGSTDGPQADMGSVVAQSQAQDQSMPGAGEPTLGQLMEMLSAYAENAQTSHGD